MQSDDWFKDAFRKAWEEQDRKIGRFNLAIFGKTGVGKSTLVNAIFGEEVAATGIGQPVTRDSHLYLHRSGHLGLIDTRGLEIGTDDGRILTELREYVAAMRRHPIADQVHLAWYCVRALDRRFEETEAVFVRELHRLGIPVAVVLTQVPRSAERAMVHPDALSLAYTIESLGLPLAGGRVHFTMAAPDEFTGQAAHGLQELLDASFRSVPAAVADALNAAQRIDLDRKRAHAKRIAEGAAAAAAAAGATPIPFSDAAVLIPIQIGMMAGIANVFNIGMERATVASVAATAAATSSGRAVVGNMMKFVPGVGSVTGGAINASVASAFTLAMGHAWLRVCEGMAEGRYAGLGSALDSSTIRTLFMDEFKSQARRRLGSRRSGGERVR